MELPGTQRVGVGYAHVVLDGGLHVTLLSGRPGGEAARELVAILDEERFDAPRLSLFDASAVEAIEPEAFEVITAYQNRRREDLSRIVTRQAIVTPRGMAGAIVSGYRAVFEFTYAVEFFTERGAALGFLGREDASAVIDALEALAAGPPLIHRLRELLATQPGASLAEATRALGISERTLQRHLQAERTRFVDEVQAARIALSKRLLVESEDKLTAIALAVGCASLQSFSAMFRRVTGESPSEYRSRARAGARS